MLLVATPSVSLCNAAPGWLRLPGASLANTIQQAPHLHSYQCVVDISHGGTEGLIDPFILMRTLSSSYDR